MTAVKPETSHSHQNGLVPAARASAWLTVAAVMIVAVVVAVAAVVGVAVVAAVGRS